MDHSLVPIHDPDVLMNNQHYEKREDSNEFLFSEGLLAAGCHSGLVVISLYSGQTRRTWQLGKLFL